MSTEKFGRKFPKEALPSNPAVFSVGNHYGFNGFPKGEWEPRTNAVLLNVVNRLRALADEAFDAFFRTELKEKSNLTRCLPGLHHEAFTNFYEFSQEGTFRFALAWFNEFLEIVKGNRNLVSEDPVWWAHAQAHALLCQELAVPERSTVFFFWRIRKWVQYFCDGNRPADAIDAADLRTAAGFFQFATRSDWRAPKWLWAWARKYYGRDEAPWKSLKTEAASMERLGEQETEALLNMITSHFWQNIDHRLSEHAARVSVGDAKTGLDATTRRSEAVGKKTKISLADGKDHKSKRRAKRVAQVLDELLVLKDETFESDDDFDSARARFRGRNYYVFQAVTKFPRLKSRILTLKNCGRAKPIALAQQIVSTVEGMSLSTIAQDWNKHKPGKSRRR